MMHPNRIQAALLLPGRFEALDAVARDFMRIAAMKSGAIFHTSEHRPGQFLRLFGGGEDLMLTFEYVDAPPPQPEIFTEALASPVTSLFCPDMAERVKSASSHILLEVSHGTLAPLGDEPQIDTLLQATEAAPASAPSNPAKAFTNRLDTLATMARVACDNARPSAVHWAQSNQLLAPDLFEEHAAIGFPGPLSIHPLLFGKPPEIGLRTFGVRHWLGREIRVPASALPWEAAYQTLIDFVALAASEDGYIIPDGDTFGPEDESEIWRVQHCDEASATEASSAANDDADASGGSVPLYELTPLRHDPCAFISEDFARECSVTMTRAPRNDREPEPLPEVASEEASCLAELQAALAEGRAEAAANPPEPLTDCAPDTPPTHALAGTPSQPGEVRVSGRSLRAKVFGAKSD
jgi:hypothetical protein